MGFVHLESAFNRALDMLWLLSVVSQIQSWHALFALSESLNVDKTAFKVQGGIDIRKPQPKLITPQPLKK